MMEVWAAPAAITAVFGLLFAMYRATMESRLNSVEARASTAEARLNDHATRLLSCEEARSDLARTNVALNQQLMTALLQMTHIVDKSTTEKGA